MMKPEVIHSVSRHVAYGLHDLLKTNAASIHAAYDWCTLFTLLEVVGAGSNPPPLLQVRPGVDVSQVVMDAGMLIFSHLFVQKLMRGLIKLCWTCNTKVSKMW